jgi:uncharacterized membrane protein YcaP (DUF421 family)
MHQALGVLCMYVCMIFKKKKKKFQVYVQKMSFIFVERGVVDPRLTTLSKTKNKINELMQNRRKLNLAWTISF